MICCIAASPALDRLLEVDRLRIGAIHRPAGAIATPGGKALNVARAARLLGAEVRVAALLGGHTGRLVAERLAAEGILCEAVWQEAETRQATTIVDADGLTELYERPEPVAAETWSRFADLSRRQAVAASWVALSGSMPPGVEGLELLGAEPLAYDGVSAGFADRSALVKVNAEEAAELTGLPVHDRATAISAAAALAAARRIAVVTLGEAGSVLVAPDGTALSAGAAARGRYPVGSGDCFLAGLLVAVSAGEGLEQALKTATGAAAANALVPGAGRLDPLEARRLAQLTTVAPA